MKTNRLSKGIVLSTALAVMVATNSSWAARKGGIDEAKLNVAKELRLKLEERFGKGAAEKGAYDKMEKAALVSKRLTQAEELNALLRADAKVDANALSLVMGVNTNRIAAVETMIQMERALQGVEKAAMDPTTKAEVASIRKSIEVITKLITKANLLGSNATTYGIAWGKMETLFVKILTEFSLSERNSYNAILEQTAKNMETKGTNIEDAFVAAVRTVEQPKDDAALLQKINDLINCK